MSDQNRKPKGQPTGGQFSEKARAEADTTLGSTPPAPPALAASLIAGDPKGFSVTGIQGHDTYDGYAYTAKLRWNGKIVGTIDQDGHGGPDFLHFQPDQAPAREAWKSLVEEWSATPDQYGIGNHNDESVLGALLTEAEVTKLLAQQVRRGGLPIIDTIEQLQHGEVGVIDGLPQDRVRGNLDKLSKQFAGRSVWLDGRWQTIPEA